MRTSLRKFRYDRGLQRKFVAKKINVCGKHLNDIEAGRVTLTDKVAEKISKLYNISIEDVISMYEEGKNEYR